MNSCPSCHQPFTITDFERSLLKKMAFTFGGKVFEIPVPTMCPDCRQKERLVWRNERSLYRRKCDLTGKPIISFYQPDSPYTVYAQDEWWSDRWDALQYGKEFDFNRPFFDQFDELLCKVPHVGMMVAYGENSDFCAYSGYYKNSYLCVSGMKGENLYYTFFCNDCTNCTDCYGCYRCEQSYECLQCVNVYNGVASKNCKNSSDIFFSENCEGCQNVIGCYGLRHQQYQILNKKVSKEEFERVKKEIFSGYQSYQAFLEQSRQFFLQFPHQALQIINTENCTGDYLLNSRNSSQCYFSENLEDCANLWNVPQGSKDSMDSNYAPHTELVYQGVSPVNSYHTISTVFSWDCKESLYAMECFYSDHLFGCMGLKHKSYCILNKQYSKDEYEKLMPKIVEHLRQTDEWGKFFPMKLSPFAYNETIAQDWFPMSKEEAANKGWRWNEYQEPIQKVEKIIPAALLPDDLKKIPDDVLNWAIEGSGELSGPERSRSQSEMRSEGLRGENNEVIFAKESESPIGEVTKRPFKIIPQELEFYRNKNLPIPRKSPPQRHLDRQRRLNPRKLFTRACGKCQKEIQTTFSPERPEIVYCECCYLESVY